MPLKQLKQIIQIKHNIVKNPNWPEADQLAIYKCGRGFELGRSVKQIQLVARAGLEPGTAGLRVRRADHSPLVLLYLFDSLRSFSFPLFCNQKKCLSFRETFTSLIQTSKIYCTLITPELCSIKCFSLRYPQY